jgi:uncharacterized protein YbjT (DUF2867 family)
MSDKIPVLVAGATGMLGFEITKKLSRQEGIEVRALIRPSALDNPHKQETLNALKNHGVQFVWGDLQNPNSLNDACYGVQTVISAVNGDADVMIDGQTNLIRAAEAAGVRRFIPSDYSVDYRKLDWGDHEPLNHHKAILMVLQGCKQMSYTLILNGVFMETLFSPFGSVFDFQKGVFKYWGDGNTEFDTTSLYDVASYTAAAALDEGLANQALEVAGDVLTMKQLKQLYEAHTIEVLGEKNQGSLSDLLTRIVRQQENAKSPMDYLPLQYHYVLVSGKGKLDRRLNDRYADIWPLSVQDYIRNHYRTEVVGVRH